MTYTPRDYSRLLGMDGLSETLLKNHFTLYQGYVNNSNKLLESLEHLHREGKTGTPEYAELKRRLGFEFNGMRVHEFYFENLGGDGKIDRSGKLAGKLAKDFGSYENWESDFKATGMIRGVGWAALYYDPVGDRLVNAWINEHQVNHFAGCVPILIMDIWEHAFMLDYQLKRADYIEAFFRNINWSAAEARMAKTAGASA
ncbi:MAG: superoxide dismutase [Dehalococcoidia bacterium]|nr:superoxide dismutase [Dehalococcoidia bacterium]